MNFSIPFVSAPQNGIQFFLKVHPTSLLTCNSLELQSGVHIQNTEKHRASFPGAAFFTFSNQSSLVQFNPGEMIPF